jgi:secreted trypsin-like serine protease
MSRFLRLAAVLLVPACVDLPATSATESNIVGGTIAHTAVYQTVVALEAGPGQWFCTGTLIAPEWILTAAHCVEGETAPGIKIRFDDDNVNNTSGGTEVAVAEVHAHPGYDGIAWDNDIALIKLAAPQTDRTPTPIHRAVAAPGTSMIQVGFGSTDDADNGAGILHELTTTSIDCTVTADATISGANVVCFDQRDGNGTCYGDSGGPSFVDVGGSLEVAAITSGGTVESCLDGFDIQTAVAGELEFIDMVMGNAPDPTDPTDPDPTTPDPTTPDPTDPDNAKAAEGGGCSAGGSAGLLIGLVGLKMRRRRCRSQRRSIRAPATR